MASNKIMSLVLVVVAVLCLSSRSSARTISSDEGVVNVRVLNSMPSNSAAIKVECKSSNGEYTGMHEFGVGAEYRFAVQLAKRYTYFCQAYWGTKFAGFEALKPGAPITAGDVFWAAKVDGFYLKSADGSKWTREAVWETE